MYEYLYAFIFGFDADICSVKDVKGIILYAHNNYLFKSYFSINFIRYVGGFNCRLFICLFL